MNRYGGAKKIETFFSSYLAPLNNKKMDINSARIKGKYVSRGDSKDNRTETWASLINEVIRNGDIDSKNRTLTRLADKINFPRIEVKNGELVIFPCSQISSKFEEFAIQYSEEIHRQFMFHIYILYRSRQFDTLRELWKELTVKVFQYTPEQINGFYEQKSEEWNDWLTDCLGLICCNAHLLKRTIVMAKHSNLIEYDLE